MGYGARTQGRDMEKMRDDGYGARTQGRDMKEMRDDEFWR